MCARWTRRALLQQVVRRGTLVGVGGLGGTAAYARYVEPFRPRVEHVTTWHANLPSAFDGFRIAHLSDLHVQPGFSHHHVRHAVALTNALNPDLVALTGDYTNVNLAPRRVAPDLYLRECVGALADLRAPSGVWACFGNHDFPVPPADPSRSLWEAAGITPLLDEAAPLRRGADSLWVAGLRSLLMRPVWPERVLSVLPPAAFCLLLWHEPDRAHEAAAAGASLQLSGHTHGGQIALPFVGPLVLPPGGQEYPAGLYRVDAMALYVTRGVGMLPPLVRWRCPPEITLLTLRRRS